MRNNKMRKKLIFRNNSKTYNCFFPFTRGIIETKNISNAKQYDASERIT